MNAQTVQAYGQQYLCHDRRPDTPWQILIKKDGNEHTAVPVFRTGWEDGGEVEIFTLLPPESCGSDEILVQIRIFTGANFNEQQPGHPFPRITTQCALPAFIHIEPEAQRILLTLMGKIQINPATNRLRIVPDSPLT